MSLIHRLRLADKFQAEADVRLKAGRTSRHVEPNPKIKLSETIRRFPNLGPHRHQFHSQ